MTLDLDRSSIDELLHAITPSRVAESLGIAVVRKGTTLCCICPFHDDHDPSLVLYDNWSSRPPHHHCFVCGADGDIFDLVRHVRNASFGEAADWLRSSFGFQQRNFRSSRGNPQRKDSDRPLWDGTASAAFNYAAEVYRRKSSNRDLNDWLKSRQLPEAIASKAGLSFALANTLTSELNSSSDDDGLRRIEIAMVEEIGLIRHIKKTTKSSELFSNVASRFRDFFFDARVIFPLQSLDGVVIGFAGRAVNDSNKDAPKYLYSPGLKKSEILYRGHVALELLKVRAKANEPKEIFVCEGLVDALRLESLGYPAVSLLGAQASKEQVEQLRRIADEVAPANDLLIHIFLDRDKAGIRGSSKLALALAENKFDADFIWSSNNKLTEYAVPASEAKDPDSLLLALGENWNRAFIDDSTHPTAFPIIATKLGAILTCPDDLLDDETWNSISLGARYRAATALSRHDSEAQFLFNFDMQRKSAYKYAWLSDVENLRSSRTAARNIQVEGRSAEFIADEISRLNVARVLAKSGADRGEVPTSNQGMFRPYIECWREFIASLRGTANRFEEVYAIRLDLKRYYDRLYRTSVRDTLKSPFKEAFQRLESAERSEDFAPSFSQRQNISNSVIDWFCEHSSTTAASLVQRVKASLSKNGMENQWKQSERLPSWNEHRRRKLIDEALRACDQFAVDVLVLPEYSVRPDTVEWLRKRLSDLRTPLSVVAGTYRLHGSLRDLYFKESFDKIFGSSDEEKVFSIAGHSMEKSAYVTLLQPMPDAGPGAVGVFSRRKKYHSMAMREFINPSDEPWAPLACLKGLIQAIEKERERTNASSLNIETVTTIAERVRAVDRMAELICSELFASTHPVNHATIFSEYRSLRQRFATAFELAFNFTIRVLITTRRDRSFSDRPCRASTQQRPRPRLTPPPPFAIFRKPERPGPALFIAALTCEMKLCPAAFRLVLVGFVRTVKSSSSFFIIALRRNKS